MPVGCDLNSGAQLKASEYSDAVQHPLLRLSGTSRGMRGGKRHHEGQAIDRPSWSRDIRRKWTMPPQNWACILNQLAIRFEGRFRPNGNGRHLHSSLDRLNLVVS